MSPEEMPNEQNAMRGPSLAAQYRAVEHKDAREAELQALTEKIATLRASIAKLESGLATGPAYVAGQGDALLELGIQLRNANKAEIETLTEELARTEAALKTKGGAVDSETIQ